MRILVRLPNWLGDAVMATPALANLRRHFAAARLVLVGSPATTQLFAGDPAFAAVISDSSKEYRYRPAGIRAMAVNLRRHHGPFDLALALTNSVSSRWLLCAARARLRVGASRGLRDLLLTHSIPVDRSAHHAEIYNSIVNRFLCANYETGSTRLHVDVPHHYSRPAVGINPGAAYGSAPRWDFERFAAVAWGLAETHDIVIFGSPAEAAMAAEIEDHLRTCGVMNYENLAGKTTVPELVRRIAGLDLFISNDSGSMHVAGAFGIPTVAIFGPTRPWQTFPWGNPRCEIVRRDLACSPCMKPTCPKGHHACMNEITPAEVLEAARRVAAKRAAA